MKLQVDTHAKKLMLLGTASNVGKSALAVAFCRIFARRGYSVAPLKSQNMALNSYITLEGEEMGRAQVSQAQAAGKIPKAIMNPVLLKPTTDVGSQVIVHGKSIGHMSAKEYQEYKVNLIEPVIQAYNALSKENDIVVMEGAGSTAEINLKKDDIVNMGMAELVDAPVIIIGDIDRGGVFAQLVGTMMLLEPEERERVIGVIINRFRGDISLLGDGIKRLEEMIGVPVLGVVRHIDADIPDEDSISNKLEHVDTPPPEDDIFDVAIIKLGKVSNFTDFEPFEPYRGLSVRYITHPHAMGNPDVLIIPSSEDIIDGLTFLNEKGFHRAIDTYLNSGGKVVGMGTGLQMLGKNISGINSIKNQNIQGLGLVDINSQVSKTKGARQVFVQTNFGVNTAETIKLAGYQVQSIDLDINQGKPLFTLYDQNGDKLEKEGFISNQIMGTTVHGIFENKEFAKLFFEWAHPKKAENIIFPFDETYSEYLMKQFDLIADEVENALDMDIIVKAMGLADCWDYKDE